ncbi:MAG: folylpolyglutamate synthase/dihydrofolate synthase family protein [Fimbriimonadaceae bacterium]
MSRLSFEEAVRRLGEFRSRGWRFGTDRMEEFLRRLGLADKLGSPGGPQYIHVAGTNGKGSVVAFLQSLLVEQGYRVGATYSPYVYDVRERVQFGRELISEEDFARLTETLLEVGETMDGTELGGPTEFEMKTALGFMYWAEKKCDWVALEVGLGGRLDATNVVRPSCSVITSVGLDHTKVLGETLGEIAREKAGIIKPDRPVVVGAVPEEARAAIQAVAGENGSPLWLFGRDVTWEDGTVQTPMARHEGLKPGLFGRIQGHNLAVAVAAMEAAGAIEDKSKLAEGAARAALPGRFERVTYQGRTFILDGAHNPQAAETLVSLLHEAGIQTPVPLVTGRIEGHEVRPFYEALGPVVAKTYVAKVDFFRAMEPSQVIEEAGDALHSATAHASSQEALQACIRETEPGDTILVTGSFYLVGEIGTATRRGTCSQ